MTLTLGSLCTGAGLLDLAVAQVLDVTPAWHAENDRHASAVLAHRWPHVPNLGDVTAVDWSTVEPVDVLCAGFPCQPVSQAGRRAGTHDERWLFDDIAAAVGRMDPRPRLLLFENVSGLLTANGGGAMARVVHGLADLGYMGSWRTLRASDVGAPHRRDRVWIVATDTGGAGAWRDGRAVPRAAQDPRRPGVDVHAAVDDRATAADAESSGFARRQGQSRERWPEPARSAPAPSDADGERLALWPELDGETLAATEAHNAPRRHDTHRLGDPAWGAYEPAVRRWERTIGRPAPAPVDDRRRLNPRFVEWMMGAPDGWVTAVPGVPRTAQLRILGNSVVPQCAAAAYSSLLAHLDAEEAA